MKRSRWDQSLNGEANNDNDANRQCEAKPRHGANKESDANTGTNDANTLVIRTDKQDRMNECDSPVQKKVRPKLKMINIESLEDALAEVPDEYTNLELDFDASSKKLEASRKNFHNRLTNQKN